MHRFPALQFQIIKHIHCTILNSLTQATPQCNLFLTRGTYLARIAYQFRHGAHKPSPPSILSLFILLSYIFFPLFILPIILEILGRKNTDVNIRYEHIVLFQLKILTPHKMNLLTKPYFNGQILSCISNNFSSSLCSSQGFYVDFIHISPTLRVPCHPSVLSPFFHCIHNYQTLTHHNFKQHNYGLALLMVGHLPT